ncbi:HAD family hydrolase [Halapricum hydrolyticum]|uniref:HAD family hydrolase n=1 Tax=Halapricum hydrolyticum TaxID=2979991 RepID=A0AAE3LDS4_9EURY|nr:HAD family hydrolase [Halapricum hydrolyticum]MCU4716963.1 HAD family hydrolase [Halapricum hydrolyticum]MCU4725432.1 HAD family hydrolase [Halapricum hydrolyticum]
MTDIDTVLFDLDGTLCRRTQDMQMVYEQAFERIGETPFGHPEALWTALEGPPDHSDTVGYFGAGFARVAAQHGRSSVDTLALARAMVSAIDDRAVTRLPGVETALESAAAVGPIGVVTNGPRDRQRTKLEALGVADRFDALVYGAELPRSKPHTAPFDRALEELGVSRGGTLYVGNSLGYDVAGAHNAGLSAAWLHEDREVGAYEPEYVIDSLVELPAILRGSR